MVRELQESTADLMVVIESSVRSCEDEGPIQIGLSRILMGPDAIYELPGEVERLTQPGPIVLLQDSTVMYKATQDLKDLVAGLVDTIGGVECLVLGEGGSPVHADEKTLEKVRAATKGAGCVVSIGSGTISDIGKDAINENVGVPLIAVQTAATVNGYADDMAVVLKEGVKRTVPSSWPSSLIIDSEVLTSAPQELTNSGYGEMMAVFTAPVDWRLASIVGADNGYDPRIVDMFRPKGEELLTIAGALADGDAAAVEFLADLLTVSGVAMGVAGLTAPCSGTEHVISHLLDMSAAGAGQPVGLHGSQVGVGALIASCIWEHVLENFDPEVLRIDSTYLAPETYHDRVVDAFSILDTTGAAAGECWSDYQIKASNWVTNRPSLESLIPEWPQLAAELGEMTCPPDRMAAALRRSGSPMSFSDLNPTVDAERARWAVQSSHLMRNRFNVVDLAFFAGLWTDDHVDAVLNRAAELGGGL